MMALTNDLLELVAIAMKDQLDTDYNDVRLGSGNSPTFSMKDGTSRPGRENSGLDSFIVGSTKALGWVWVLGTWTMEEDVTWTDADFVGEWVGEIGFFNAGNNLRARWTIPFSSTKSELTAGDSMTLTMNITMNVMEAVQW